MLLTDREPQVSVASATLFTAFSIGTALAPNLASFFIFRILTAFQGTAFLVIGSAVIGDIYKPVRITEALLKRTYTPRLESPSTVFHVLKLIEDLDTTAMGHCDCSR